MLSIKPTPMVKVNIFSQIINILPRNIFEKIDLWQWLNQPFVKTKKNYDPHYHYFLDNLNLKIIVFETYIIDYQ
ncbi:MAG: hypothetical protein HPY79_01820 [Bacteroidales bacterium]|nr:hypothetical protein [Bacteroidales bacterium]